MIKYLLVASLWIHLITAQKQARHPWKTQYGHRPLVIARGGFSGLAPESSGMAFNMAGDPFSLPDTVLYCDLQLTKDSVGFCNSDISLDNTTNISIVYPDSRKTYTVNGQKTSGWFAVDYIAEDLFSNVTLIQSVLTRPNVFDGEPLLTVDELIEYPKPPSTVWLNIQYDKFLNQHKVSPAEYLEEKKFKGISYISSPEIGFLKTIATKVDKDHIKVILKFGKAEAIEPTTKQTYEKILNNLESIKPFATGILVPKTYIWPVNKDGYLMPPTNLVVNTHRQGLAVYAYGFASDLPGSYNYSYDPTLEYVQFVENGRFSVDGIVTDFPTAASEAIACFAHHRNETLNHKGGGRALVISHNGASGEFAGCTDLAYEKAVKDGADIIDCSVQMTKDGVSFCLDTADLLGDTNAIQKFMSRSSNVPDIQPDNGIFSFDLTWEEIKTLKPQLVSPVLSNSIGLRLPRNPAFKDKGRFFTVQEFLEFAKGKPVSGVLIEIQNAAYLASHKGIDIMGSVTSALNNVTFEGNKTVMIQSDDTSVLSKFKEFPDYKRVLKIKEEFTDAPNQTVDEIKKYADAIDIRKPAVWTSVNFFIANFTKVVEEMHAGNVSVHVSVLNNEFTTFAFDFLADPMIELATLVERLNVDAVVTDFPGTATTYMNNPCSDPKNKSPEFPIRPATAGGFLAAAITKPSLPEASPPLSATEIVNPPLPPVAVIAKASSPPPTKAPVAADEEEKPNKSYRTSMTMTNLCISLVTTLAINLLLITY